MGRVRPYSNPAKDDFDFFTAVDFNFCYLKIVYARFLANWFRNIKEI